jgi:hypothetical protein
VASRLRNGRFAKISDRDNGARALVKRVKDARKGAVVTVGIHEAEGSAAHGDDVTLADVASFAEFGLGNPQRSFLRDWFDENEAENRERLRKIGQAVIDGKVASVEQGLDRFGLFAVGSIQQRISAGIAPPNAESTIAAKGSSVPLIDLGTLRAFITHKVET